MPPLKAPTTSNAKIQLRDGKQLSLPSWMTFHHLPEYGIASSQSSSGAFSSSSAASASMPTDATAHKPNSTHEGAEGTRSTRKSSRRGTSSDLNTYTAPQISASNYKPKKEMAIDSLYPPTTQEIYGHIRYLSEEGMTLVMKEVDDCVGYSLKYSATEKSDLEGGETVLVHENKMDREDLKTNLMTLAAEIHNYLDMFQPDDEEDEAAALKIDDCVETIKSEAGTIQREDIIYDMVPKKYDPTLLPMIAIKCHPNILDRGEMTNGLLADLSKKQHRCNQHSQTALRQQHHQQQQREVPNGTSSCVCIVRSTSDLVQQGHIMTEILSQCISNDPNGEAFAMELQRQRKRQKSHPHSGVGRGVLVRSMWSWTRSLVEWAGFTEAFDSIVVILEDPEKIPSPTLDSFFTTLASLRSSHGVPISVIVIDATPGGLGDRLSTLRDPSLRGTMGVVARELFVPLPQVQLDMFVNRLFSGKCIPTFLWTNAHLLKHIQELFQECDNSIVSVAKQFKTELRRYFSVPGAFVSLLNCKQFIVPNESRITWLFGDEHCRKIMLSHSASNTPSSTKEDQKDGHIFDLFWKMQTSYLCHQLCQRINVIFNVSLLRKIGQAAGSEFHLTSRMLELLRLLGNVRHKIMTWEEASVASSHLSVSLCKKLNEFIILVGTFASGEESNPSTARALVEHIMMWASEQFSMQMTLAESPPVQPRREVAKSLSLPAPDALMDCSLVHARRIAFQVFQSRVMTLADWHEQYFDIVADQDGGDLGVSSNEAAFFFVVYELIHCGFVRRLTTGRRKEEAYEKVAIVWGSGR